MQNMNVLPNSLPSFHVKIQYYSNAMIIRMKAQMASNYEISHAYTVNYSPDPTYKL
jgi:hypothetical protein